MARSRSPVDRVLGAVVPRVVDAVDPDELVGHIDVDALIQRVDVDGIIQRVDIDGIIQRVDINALMERVDINALMARVDMDELLAQVDVAAIVSRAGIDQIVAEATTGIATRTLDAGRRQVLGIDTVLLRVADRIMRRPRSSLPADGAAFPAGPVARLLGFLVDTVVVTATFGFAVFLGGSLLELFTSRSIDLAERGGPAWAVPFFGWWFLYLWAGVAVAGRTVGKGLLGLRVVSTTGGGVGVGAAAFRAVVFPFSFIGGLGFVPAVLGREHRALHDYAAGTKEVVDWGSRQAKLPAVLHDHLSKRT